MDDVQESWDYGPNQEMEAVMAAEEDGLRRVPFSLFRQSFRRM